MAAKNRTVGVQDIQLQLCEPRTSAFTRPGWLWELKFDGFRALVSKEAGKSRIVFRRGRDAADKFVEIAEAVDALPAQDFILDGELVIQDAQGKPIFQKLLERSTLTRPREIRALAESSPA
ncbi:MAG: ligase, partial [Myxococcaceae bacterium]|nr:ligase [Myxococcaceae bacterium]